MLASSSRKLESDSLRCGNPRLSLFGKRSSQPCGDQGELALAEVTAAQIPGNDIGDRIVALKGHVMRGDRRLQARAVPVPAVEHLPLVEDGWFAQAMLGDVRDQGGKIL